MFDAEDAPRAAGVPLYYSSVQLLLIASYLFWCWKAEWTYAPAAEPVWRMLKRSYQHRQAARVRGSGFGEIAEGLVVGGGAGQLCGHDGATQPN